MHTRLPVAVLSATVGPLRLSQRDQRILCTKLIPWAITCRNSSDLLCLFYEEHFTDDLEDFRRRIGLTKAPTLDI